MQIATVGLDLAKNVKVWKTGTPYDESTYLNALKKRGSPLAALGMQPAKFA